MGKKILDLVGDQVVSLVKGNTGELVEIYLDDYDAYVYKLVSRTRFSYLVCDVYVSIPWDDELRYVLKQKYPRFAGLYMTQPDLTQQYKKIYVNPLFG